MVVKKTIAVAVAVVVAITLITAVVIPIVGSSSSQKLVYKNTGSYFTLTDDADETVHTIIVSTGTNGFVITTDGKIDKTPSFGNFTPGGQRQATAIAIGVYESGKDASDVMVSQTGISPLVNEIPADFRAFALNGNYDNTIGTYEIWNYYQYTLNKIMSLAVMGNTDSQYMMGPGDTNNSDGTNTTGLTAAPYTKSATATDSVSIFIENCYGSAMEYVGDTYTTNYVLKAGNTLGGGNTVKSVLTENIRLPTSNENYIDTIYLTNEGIGTALTVGGTSVGVAGQAINDVLRSSNGDRVLYVGGAYGDGPRNGLLYQFTRNSASDKGVQFGTRLAYVMTDYEPTTTDYGYVITFGEGGSTITGVQALVDGVLTDENPTGTTLNSYWDFDTTTGIGPFGSYYVAINLNEGANTDDETEARLSTQKGAIGYILDPTDFTKTLAGTTFTSTEYNVMLVIPTVYWGVADGKLYMSNNPDTFSTVEGLTMESYAHNYTIDPSVDTHNPMSVASASLCIGEDSIVRLYETGDIYVIKANAMTKIGQVTSETPITLTVTGSTLGYTIGTTDYTEAKYQAYISHEGKYVYAKNPTVVPDTDIIIIGGYAYDLEVKDGDDVNDVVNIGYCASGKLDSESADYITVTATLNPVSRHSYTVTDTDITVNLTNVKTDLYKVKSVLFTTAWEDSGTDKGNSVATYTYFLVPETVVYENEDYAGETIGTLLNIIPILMIIGILMLVVSVMFVRKGGE